MRFDSLSSPLSEAAPCGLDLNEADDDEFVDNVIYGEDKLPPSFRNAETYEIFDPSGKIDIKAETKKFDAFLKQTYDLRILTLDARFQIVCGRFKGFAESLLGIATLLESFFDTVHPVDSSDRLSTLNQLDNISHSVMPLRYATLVNHPRFGAISFHDYEAATGAAKLREDETPPDASNMLAALGDDTGKDEVTNSIALFDQAFDAIKRIENACRNAEANSFKPTFDKLVGQMTEIRAFFSEARPELAVKEETSETAGDQGEPLEQINVGFQVKDQTSARKVLESVERYFTVYEPSAPTLLLVTQAKLLIGRSMVDAMQTLVSNKADQALFSFGAGTDFSISMSQMRELVDQAEKGSAPEDEPAPEPIPEPEPEPEPEDPAEGASETVASENSDEDVVSSEDSTEGLEEEEADKPEPEPEPEAVPEPEPEPEPTPPSPPSPAPKPAIPEMANSRNEAGVFIKSVEDFFRVQEPTSPIPILLAKARGFINHDFNMVVRDLLESND